MSLTLSEENVALRDAAQGLLRQRAPVSSLRRLRDEGSERGFAQDLWEEMVQLGWSGILLPEEHGGAQLGYLEMGVVLWECGRKLAPSPLLSSALVCATALNVAGSTAQQQAYSPGIASGERLFALAHDEGAHHHDAPVATTARPAPGGFRLTGEKRFVLDGHVADTFIVSARTTDGDAGGVVLLVVDSGLPGVSVTRTQMVDSHNAAIVRFEDVEVSQSCVLAAPRGGSESLRRVLDAGRAGVAAQMLGVAEEAFARTLAYLKERKQFGVPIGSFQALQHRAAIMFCELELSKSALLDALSALDEDRNDAALAVSAAKAQLCETLHLISNEAVQLHGGIGMTDEHEIGFFLKRARVLAHTFGDSAFHLDRYAALSGY